jgi:methionyl-tRNA formyltransferase
MLVYWCLANSEKQTGATIITIDEGLDTGQILAQATTE